MWRRKLNSKAELESNSFIFQFQALSSRRFQRGFDRVNLHHPTSACSANLMAAISRSWSSAASSSLPWTCAAAALVQGLTLVHFSAQLEPGLTQESTLHNLSTP